MCVDSPLFSTLQKVMDLADDTHAPADVMESPSSYVYIIDTSGFKHKDIKVQVDDNVLVISDERKREEEKEGAKYVKTKRRVGKLMAKFVLPETTANTDAISAVCRDGVLIVSVKKLPPPEPKKPKKIEVKLA